MEISQPIALADDTLLIPVQQLDDDVRSRLECEPDDFAVSRPASRTPSSVVDASTAELLQIFRKPRTIVEAVILFSRSRGLDPEQTLEGAYPVLRRLLGHRFLVSSGNEAEAVPPLDGLAGVQLEGLEVVELMHTLEDTALYVARDRRGRPVALKVQRSDDHAAAGCLEHEAAALARLDGAVAPRLLAAGETGGRRYLAMEWCLGAKPDRVAAELRGLPAGESRARLLELCRRIAGAYARLHGLGVLHGDVHPDNILVDRQTEVRLIDFGLARIRDTDSESQPDLLGGVPFFYEPEYARALRHRTPPPHLRPAAEQYALAAVLYYLATGHYYLDFQLERDEMLRQIVEEPPLAFDRRGLEPWPELESVLARALAKEPAERFEDMTSFAAALDSVPDPPGTTAGPMVAERLSPALVRSLQETLGAAAVDGPWLSAGLEPAPTASVNFGAAGIACGLYRIGCQTDDASALAAADVWARRAAAAIGDEEGFYNPDNDLGPERLGRSSPYHTPSGVWAMQALIARALGDHGTQAGALEGFVTAVRAEPAGLDLTLGHAGAVLVSALLLDALPETGSIPRQPLLETGRASLEAIGDEVGSMARIGEATLDNLGIAHGWAGLLYAALQWRRASADALPDWVEVRLDELARQALPAGRGLHWPWQLRRGSDGRRPFMPGWCNGSSGYVFLWTLAARLLERPRYLDLAVGAAWDAWEAPGSSGSLCCGFAGRAYALLNLYRHAGDAAWLRRAGELGHRGVKEGFFEPDYPHSLYKGRLALAVLAADLERPEESAQPFFEEERWPAD